MAALCPQPPATPGFLRSSQMVHNLGSVFSRLARRPHSRPLRQSHTWYAHAWYTLYGHECYIPCSCMLYGHECYTSCSYVLYIIWSWVLCPMLMHVIWWSWMLYPMLVCVICYMVMGVTSHHFCHACQKQVTLRRKGRWHRVRALGGHLQEYLHFSSSPPASFFTF